MFSSVRNTDKSFHSSCFHMSSDYIFYLIFCMIYFVCLYDKFVYEKRAEVKLLLLFNRINLLKYQYRNKANWANLLFLNIRCIWKAVKGGTLELLSSKNFDPLLFFFSSCPSLSKAKKISSYLEPHSSEIPKVFNTLCLDSL